MYIYIYVYIYIYTYIYGCCPIPPVCLHIIIAFASESSVLTKQ